MIRRNQKRLRHQSNFIFRGRPFVFLSDQTDWIRETTPQERTALTAAFGGYAVDAFDYMIYSFIIPTLIVAWGMSNTEAGVIATGSLLSLCVGGWAAGVLGERDGGGGKTQ